MTTQAQINRAEMRDAPAERGGRNRPMAAPEVRQVARQGESTAVQELRS